MATAHNELCPELIVEIFTRLPTQSLLRFRSVSKSICGMIGSPDFIRLHAVRSPKKFTVIHRVNYKAEGITKSMYTINSAGEGQLSYIGTTPVEYPFARVNIVGSCNGILCVYEIDKRIIHLWNPSIRRKATVRFVPVWTPGLALGRIWVRNTDAAWSLAFKLDMRQPVQSINGDLVFSGCYSSKGIIDYHDPETGVPSRLVDLTGSSSYVNAMITCIESLELLHFGTSCHQGKQALDC
ncbi:putative F-box domain-containing protein [Helianthus annuus]|nr:putative F-box domain-containing protein [Helianthus annuus]